MGAAIGDVERRRPARSAEDALRRRHPGAVSQPRQRPVRGRGDDGGTRRAEPPRRVGRRAAGSRQRRPRRTCSTSPGTSIPRSSATLPQYPHRGPRVVFRNLGSGRFADVTAESGARCDDAALEPRRRVRRLRQRRRRRRARDEHERAAVAAAQRLRRTEPLAERSPRGRASNRTAIGATVIVTAGGRTQARAVVSQSSYYSHDDLRLHFGLGAATTADRIEVRWPSGSDAGADATCARGRSSRSRKRRP